MSAFDTTIDGGDLGELSVTVEFDYQPATGDGWHEPKYPESAEITSVKHGGRDVFWLLPTELCKALEDEALEHVAARREDALMAQAEARAEDRV